jgi:hypothetical protein
MTRGDRLFLDTNVLLEATDTARPLHHQAHDSQRRAKAGGLPPNQRFRGLLLKRNSQRKAKVAS